MNDMELADWLHRWRECLRCEAPCQAYPCICSQRTDAIIAALRRGPERRVVTDAMIEAVIRRARDGHPPAILDGSALYHIRGMLQTAMDAIERPPSGEMVMVPREPTKAMIEAGKDERMECFKTDGRETNPITVGEGLTRIYRAMLSAAEAEGRKS